MALNKQILYFLAEDFLFDDDGDDQAAFSSSFLMLSVIAATKRKNHLKIQNYVEETVPNYYLDDFRRFFRVTRGTFEELCRNLNTNPRLLASWTGGREPISVEKHLLITLWYLATQDTLHNIADRFNVTESSVVRCRTRVYGVFLDELKARVISWPRGAEQQEVKNKFYEKRNFPGVVGAVDGSHIKIKAPRQHPETYVNRKGFHSIILQGVCREDMRFIHCVAGWPGSCHDSRVLKNTDVWERGLQLCGDGHLIGDAAYPLRRWLLTPYRDNGHLTPQQRNYNTSLSTTRVVVERAFGILKGRFRRLQYIDTKDLKTAVDTIIVCCIVHNICILNEDDVQDFFVYDEDDDVDIPIMFVQDNDAEGPVKRDAISRQLN